MSQLTLYLDAETAARLKDAATGAGMSQSQWVARLIRERTSQEWPESVKALAGAWPEMPTAEEIRSAASADSEREAL
jgi:hypothetical protein